jgi:ABC-type uncharacterized transport system permease subunit
MMASLLRYNGISIRNYFTLSMLGSFSYSLAAFLYASLGYVFWRANWTPKPSVGAMSWRGIARFAILIPLGLHVWLLITHSWGAGTLSMGVGNALSGIVWLALAVYALSSLRQPVDALYAVILPVAAVAVLLPLLMPGRPVQLAISPLLLAHIAVAFLAYALFTIAALHAGMMAMLEKRLHEHAASRSLPNLPPLLTLEHLLFRIIGIGFVLLTLALASGILFSEQLFGKPFSFVHFTQHKTVFALLSWLIYAGLLIGRKVYGWRGRIAIRWSLTGFAMLILAYVGSKIVLQLLLGR